jgi:hypothetical protein
MRAKCRFDGARRSARHMGAPVSSNRRRAACAKSFCVAIAGVLAVAACDQSATGVKPATAPVPALAESPAPPATAARPAGFDQTLDLQGITFHVSSANVGSLNRLRIEPKGLKGDNAVILQEIEGTVTMAEVADLNVDGSPEVYVYVTSAGSGSHGSLVAYAANKGRSLSAIFLPPLADDPKASKGYMGHDEFRVVENTLVRRFPVYRDGDTNAQPTGGTRQVQYKLNAGEAGWVLRPDRTEDY